LRVCQRPVESGSQELELRNFDVLILSAESLAVARKASVSQASSPKFKQTMFCLGRYQHMARDDVQDIFKEAQAGVPLQKLEGR
jgi:hypothetical protein